MNAISLPVSDDFILLMIPLVLVTALIYVWVFDSDQEAEYPDVPIYVQMVDGMLRIFTSLATAGWIAIMIVLAGKVIKYVL